jgi:magnesium-transporting ATPase (P-type)
MSAAPNAYANSTAAAWHAISNDDVVKRLATDRQKGLDAAEASKRLQKYGPNRLPEGKKRGPLMRFLAQFNNILVYVLLGAGFIKLMPQRASSARSQRRGAQRGLQWWY